MVEQAIYDTYSQIIAHWNKEGDGRNRILALYRMCYTLHFKQIVPKNVADNGLSRAWMMTMPIKKLSCCNLMHEYTGQGRPQDWACFHSVLTEIVAGLSHRLERYFAEHQIK